MQASVVAGHANSSMQPRIKTPAPPFRPAAATPVQSVSWKGPPFVSLSAEFAAIFEKRRTNEVVAGHFAASPRASQSSARHGNTTESPRLARQTQALTIPVCVLPAPAALTVFVDSVLGDDATCAPCSSIPAALDVAWASMRASQWWTNTQVFDTLSCLLAPRVFIVSVAGNASEGLQSLHAASVLDGALSNSALMPHLTMACFPRDLLDYIRLLYRLAAGQAAINGIVSQLGCPEAVVAAPVSGCDGLLGAVFGRPLRGGTYGTSLLCWILPYSRSRPTQPCRW